MKLIKRFKERYEKEKTEKIDKEIFGKNIPLKRKIYLYWSTKLIQKQIKSLENHLFIIIIIKVWLLLIISNII